MRSASRPSTVGSNSKRSPAPTARTNSAAATASRSLPDRMTSMAGMPLWR